MFVLQFYMFSVQYGQVFQVCQDIIAGVYIALHILLLGFCQLSYYLSRLNMIID